MLRPTSTFRNLLEQRKRQFLPLLAGAEAGRETQAPETTSLIYAQRIYPRPGVLA